MEERRPPEIHPAGIHPPETYPTDTNTPETEPVQHELQIDEAPAIWEESAPEKAPVKDPVPMRIASILVLLFGAFNAIYGVLALIAWGEAAMALGLGKMALQALLLPIGLLQVFSGVIMLKYTKERSERLKALCRSLGYAMLLVTVTYIISNVMIQGFVASTLTGPIIAIAYMAVQK